MTDSAPDSSSHRDIAAEIHGLPVPELETILRTADAAASVAHDFIWGRRGVTKEQASEAIWTIHNALRPLFEDDPEPSGRDDAASRRKIEDRCPSDVVAAVSTAARRRFAPVTA